MRLFATHECISEGNFAYDEAMIFRAEMRRNKIIGRWAAGIFNLSAEETEAYICSLIHLDLQRVDEEDLFYRLKRDFEEKNIGQSDQALLTALEVAMQQALAFNR